MKKVCANHVDTGSSVICSIFLKNKDIFKRPNRTSYKPFSPEGVVVVVVVVRERLKRKRI